MNSSTPEAVAMRRLRANRREVAGLPRDAQAARLQQAVYLRRVITVSPGATGPIQRDKWEGRMQVDGKPLVVARSVKKYGSRHAYRLCVRQLKAWLIKVYPAKLVQDKCRRMLAIAPAGPAR